MDAAPLDLPVRVVLVDMARLTRELIRGLLEDEPGIEVVRELAEAGVSIRELVEETRAELVIVGATSGLLAECRDFLAEHALVRILAVSPDGRAAQLHGVRPYETLAESLAAELVLAVASRPRSASGGPAG
jgi:DNA-binding NarL/FixJ family response regulator